MSSMTGRYLASIVLCAALFLVPGSASAATFGVSPSVASRSVGDSFTATVFVSSPDQSVNAVSGVLSFNPSLLEVASVSKANSVLGLWVQDPVFSNAQGTVSFEGVILNPGFQGAQGTVLSVTFRAKASGTATVGVTTGSILANDGQGTNVATGFGSAQFSLGGSTTAPSTPPDDAPPQGSGSGPKIVSSTHPDEAKWYPKNVAEFSWNLGSGVLEVRTGISQSRSAVPSVRYAPPITSRKVDGLSDGTHYFTLQARTASGWGEISRYRINIDTEPPRPFSISFPHGARNLEPQPVILFNTTDGGSGISGYDIKINSGGPERVALPATSNPYPLPPQRPGTYTVMVTAIDEAGNTRTTSEDFTVEAIETPVITYYEEEIVAGDLFKVRGTTYANADVYITVYEKDEVVFEEYTRSNSLGDFATVFSKRLDPGVYHFTARVVDGRGAQSYESTPLTVIVNSRFLNALVSALLSYLSAFIIGILALGALVVLGVYTYLRATRAIRRMRREANEAEEVLEKSFALLRKDVREHMRRLKRVKSKRELTTEELQFLEQFEDTLEEAEDVIAKEIKDIFKKPPA